MPWPPALVHEFDLVDPGTPKESDYYGPYNSLLHYLFPISQDFLIFPQPKGPVFPDTAEDATIFVVTAEQHPVFFLEVKPWRDINDLRARGVTDREMRERFQRLIGELRLPKLYGLSAMGPRYAVYEYTAATSAIEPKAIPPHPRLVNDIAPVSRWDNDLLTDVGEIKIRSVVRTVKEMRQEARQSKPII
ncbi:hypothetical protein LshimejAT787_0903780 [Lyophyllum shimeji]|uniref:Uncharacterized protein n=1 Tax=Lyophyllum shimeji TaxID=47721 RepID=A0A9P3PT88_LYOSH|nr:hypothetical protein LshimejAT787_0903780 [Lyophyllum shimeji]